MKRNSIFIGAGILALGLMVLVRQHGPQPGSIKPLTAYQESKTQHALVHQPIVPTSLTNGEGVVCSYSVMPDEGRDKLFRGHGKWLTKISPLEFTIHNQTDQRLTLKSRYLSMPALDSEELSEILNASMKTKMKLALATATVVTAVSTGISVGFGPLFTGGKIALSAGSKFAKVKDLVDGYDRPGIFYLQSPYSYTRIGRKGKIVTETRRPFKYQERLILEPGSKVKALLFVPRKKLTSSMSVTLKNDQDTKFMLVAHQMVRAI